MPSPSPDDRYREIIARIRALVVLIDELDPDESGEPDLRPLAAAIVHDSYADPDVLSSLAVDLCGLSDLVREEWKERSRAREGRRDPEPATSGEEREAIRRRANLRLLGSAKKEDEGEDDDGRA